MDVDNEKFVIGDIEQFPSRLGIELYICFVVAKLIFDVAFSIRRF